MIAIGTELLLGETVEGNGAWLGRRLAALGIPVVRRTTVGDDDEAITASVHEALQRTGALVCTGGLGPTSDDRTRPAVARVFGRELVLDEEWLEVIRARFRARGLVMPESNRVQAEKPAGSTLLPNQRGTAPGLALEDPRLGMAILLPGVPSEMQWLMDEQVVPFLRSRGWIGRGRIRSRTLRTTGISESALAERVADLTPGFDPLTLAYLPTGLGEDLRLTSWGDLEEADAEGALARAELQLRDRLGGLVYGADSEDLAEIVGRQLRARGLKIGLAESCTGGLLAKRLTDAAGSSDYMAGAVVAYENAAKVRLLGVRESTIDEHGAVSAQVAREMAAGARAAFRADVAISVTGIAGPGGGTEEKPVGTVWIALAIDDRIEVRRLRLAGDRIEVRERSAQAALDLLRRQLVEHPS